MACLKNNSADHFPCKGFSKAYLSCRMKHNLMREEDLDTLGLGDSGTYVRAESKDDGTGEFVAGVNVRGGKWFG